MECIKADSASADQWAVVYGYGSVLATFENEHDAQAEATGFGGAVVRLARNLWSTLSVPDAVATAEGSSRPL
jgi:hypothetical protein